MEETKYTPYDLEVDDYIKDVLVYKKHIENFYPPQGEVLFDSDILNGKNTLVYMQTAAGKTLIAEVVMIDEILERKGKIVYTVPLKALASEKYYEFSKDWGEKVRVNILVGDNLKDTARSVANDIRIGNESDIIITTNEKLDSLLRHNVSWLRKITILVVDEIHNIISDNRGPVIEVLIAKLRQLRTDEEGKEKIQIIGLSATLGNAQEVADWLDASLVPTGSITQTIVIEDEKTGRKKKIKEDLPLSEWRPVDLKKGIYNIEFGAIAWVDKRLGLGVSKIPQTLYHKAPSTDTESKHNAVVSLTVSGMKPEEQEDIKQVLVFTATRKQAENTAKMLAGKKPKKTLKGEEEERRTGYIYPYMKTTEKQRAEKLATIMSEDYTPSDKEELLFEIFKRGAVWHHAGLRSKQRNIIENSFREKVLKVICATPTLAAGVNLPAKRVILATHQRWDSHIGDWADLPKYEVTQMLGRAGRPGYDNIGEGILIAKNTSMFKKLKEKYIDGPIEDIVSHLGEESPLRKHLLSYIAAKRKDIEGVVKKAEWVKRVEIEDFILKTFFGYQVGNITEIQHILGKVFDFYITNGLVEYNQPSDSFLITKFGKRTVELYIDPLTAVMIKQGLELLTQYKGYATISWINLLAYSPDILSVNAVGDKEKDRERILIFTKNELELGYRFFSVDLSKKVSAVENPIPIGDPLGKWKFLSEEMQEFLTAMKITMIMEYWISEISENEILEKFQSGEVNPGDIARYRESYDWLMYSSIEIAKIFGHNKYIEPFQILGARIKKGIKTELFELTKLKGIGRARARQLYKRKFRTLDDLRRASEGEIMLVEGIGPKIAKSIKEQLKTKGETKIIPKLFEKE
jgi:helicase